jgi:hypothetical protein
MFLTLEAKRNETKSMPRGKKSLSLLAESRFDGVGERIADRRTESRNDIYYVKFNVSACVSSGDAAE